ncbi:hypothetical protein LTR37_009792 [Vermiconidia calcicola]|uniref:Uncharacterized protein n=1 Tax=Vermiconidia calcicola TaxID=1690605 RepID=A0ACC3N6K5_9PEZI|nr:hypothetical protein LTR37_009792 [Vermiconidia calcicola]
MPPPRRLDFAPKVSSPLARCIYLVSPTPHPPPPPPEANCDLLIDPILLASRPPARSSIAHLGSKAGASAEDDVAMVSHAYAEYNCNPDCYLDSPLINVTPHTTQARPPNHPRIDQDLASSPEDVCHSQQARQPVQQNSHATSTKPASAISTTAKSLFPQKSPSTSLLRLPASPAAQHDSVTRSRKRRLPQQGGQERYGEPDLPSVVVGESVDVPRLASEEQMTGRRTAPMRRQA